MSISASNCYWIFAILKTPLLSIDSYEDVWICYIKTSPRRADRDYALWLDYGLDFRHIILLLPVLSSESVSIVYAEPAKFQCGFILNGLLGDHLVSHADPGVTMLAVRAPKTICRSWAQSIHLTLCLAQYNSRDSRVHQRAYLLGHWPWEQTAPRMYSGTYLLPGLHKF